MPVSVCRPSSSTSIYLLTSISRVASVYYTHLMQEGLEDRKAEKVEMEAAGEAPANKGKKKMCIRDR